MKSAAPDYVTGALRDPASVLHATLPEWEALIRDAREANLLARLAAVLCDVDAFDHLPPAPRAHLAAARTIAGAQARGARREIDAVRRALEPLGIPVVLLKGAAYQMAGLAAAHGRLFSDIDILVSREALPRVEAALMLAGWATTHLDPYDQRYYRNWMHELPPMQHTRRATVLDVHHAILPLTARLKPDSAKLIGASRPLAGAMPLHVPAPHDLVLHSAAHLFLDEELGHGLRDLVDLDSLLRQFDRDAGFWSTLVSRASEMDLVRPLYYALRWTARVMGTPVPGTTLDAVAAGGPPPPIAAAMDVLLAHALRPCAAVKPTRWARRMLYVRGHWLKMPPHLLAWHLAHKALRRREDAE